MKYKYRTDGISKNKKIREHRKKPLPLELMRHDETDRDRTIRQGIPENNVSYKAV